MVAALWSLIFAHDYGESGTRVPVSRAGIGEFRWNQRRRGDSRDAAVRSRSQVSVPLTGTIPAAGYFSSPGDSSRISRTTAAFFPPATRNTICRAAFRTGNVIVIRSTGGGNTPGGLAVTQRSCTCSAGLPGKTDAV